MEKRKIFYFAGLILLFIISLAFDAEIVKFISGIQNNFLNDFFGGITSLSSGIVIFFILTSLFLWKEHKRKWILPLWFTLFLSAIVSFVLKIIVRRPRPFQLDLVAIWFLFQENYLIWNFSFPSFHAMFAFCAIPILSKEFPKLKYFWIIFAVLIAFSRIYFGVHFLSDVIFGGAIGYLLGNLIIRIERKNKFWEKIYLKIFKKN